MEEYKIMKVFRSTLFIFLVLIAIGGAFAAWFIPWWSCHVVGLEGYVQIRPWGLEHDLGATAGFIAGSDMPAYFAPLMWTFFVLSIVALLFSLFIKNKTFNLLGKRQLSLPGTIIGLVGFSYICVAAIGLIVMAIRTGDFFGTHLVGTTAVFNVFEEPLNVQADLGIGYYLLPATGVFCILLALLRSIIVGKN
jgi:hypothetical protein